MKSANLILQLTPVVAVNTDAVGFNAQASVSGRKLEDHATVSGRKYDDQAMVSVRK